MSNNYILAGYYAQLKDNILCTKNQFAMVKKADFGDSLFIMEEIDIFSPLCQKGLKCGPITVKTMSKFQVLLFYYQDALTISKSNSKTKKNPKELNNSPVAQQYLDQNFPVVQ